MTILLQGAGLQATITTPVVPPLFSSAEIGTVNASTVVVTFDQNVAANENDFASGVTIKVNGVATSISGGIRQTDHAVIWYDIPVLWHGSGDVVTWEYNSGTGVIVAESGGASLGDVTAQSVTNNCEYSTVPGTDIQADTVTDVNTTPFAGTGTITQSGNTVTMSNAVTFAGEVVVGDRITAVGIDGIVQSIHAAIPDCVLDTSADVAVGVPFTVTPQASTPRINSIIDQTPGNAHGFSQTGTKRPALQTSNSHPAIVFDSWNDYMTGGNWGDNLASFAVICAGNVSGGGPDIGPILARMSDWFTGAGWATETDSILIQSDGADTYYQIGGTSPNGLHVFSVVKHSNSSFNIYRDGVVFEGDTTDGGPVVSFANPADPMTFGGFNGGSELVGGAVFGVLMCVPEPSATNRAALEARLAARYGITLP